MTMEVDARPSSPTLMMSSMLVSKGQGKETIGNTQITTQTTTNLSGVEYSLHQSNTTYHPGAPRYTPVDEAFVMENYSQLEPLVRIRMKGLRLRGAITRLDYSSEDVDEEMQMEGHLETPWKTYQGEGHWNDTLSPSSLLKWIKEFYFLDVLKVPPHVGHYDGKGDPKNFLHVFEGAMKMEKWTMPVSCHIFVMSTWKTFGGNTRDLGSILEETDKLATLHNEGLKNCLQKVETASGLLATLSR
ncbi:hypothetical protein Tco_0842487 [Tanacetum coccineum]|uniref:Uncharacterized protein n=1 Tax=Tanacetum coccineum TaxID=301880 RepID=A0ABQ5AZF0_9ASTR